MEDFVTFELANKLKEKGFPQHMCEDGYIVEEDERYDIGDKEMIWVIPDYLPYIAAPTIAQALKWLRDTYKLFLSPCVIADFYPDITYWSFEVVNIESGDYVYREYEHIDEKRFSSYEEASLAGIEYVLDNLI